MTNTSTGEHFQPFLHIFVSLPVFVCVYCNMKHVFSINSFICCCFILLVLHVVISLLQKVEVSRWCLDATIPLFIFNDKVKYMTCLYNLMSKKGKQEIRCVVFIFCFKFTKEVIIMRQRWRLSMYKMKKML